MKKSFVHTAAESGPKDFVNVLREGLMHYSNTISNSLAPINVIDIPLVVAALEIIAKDLRTAYPKCGELTRNIQENFKHETIILGFREEK